MSRRAENENSDDLHIYTSWKHKKVVNFPCRGFDTFDPFKKIGGVAKGHPNEKDLSEARAWIELKIQAHKKSV